MEQSETWSHWLMFKEWRYPEKKSWHVQANLLQSSIQSPEQSAPSGISGMRGMGEMGGAMTGLGRYLIGLASVSSIAGQLNQSGSSAANVINIVNDGLSIVGPLITPLALSIKSKISKRKSSPSARTASLESANTQANSNTL